MSFLLSSERKKLNKDI